MLEVLVHVRGSNPCSVCPISFGSAVRQHIMVGNTRQSKTTHLIDKKQKGEEEGEKVPIYPLRTCPPMK